MEKITQFMPAFDRRDPNPDKNYGIHGVDLRMVLKGDKGAVQFVLFTNWQLPHVQEEQKSRMTPSNHILYEPIPADLGYHSLEPHYNGQEPRNDCEYLNGKPCYYDGSGLNAELIYQVLLKEGSEGVWKELQEYYNQVFNK